MRVVGPGCTTWECIHSSRRALYDPVVTMFRIRKGAMVVVAVGSAVIGNSAPLLTDLDAEGLVELVQV